MTPRIMLPSDRGFVVGTWANGARYRMRRSERFQLVNRILDAGARVIVLGTTGTAVHGWAAGDGARLHYVYVPPELRGQGLARQAITELLGAYPAHIETTHPWPRPSRRFRHVPEALYLRSEAA